MSLCGLGISCERSCEHGVHVNQEQCHYCELQVQIKQNRELCTRELEKLKEIYALHDNLHTEWSNRIEQLEQYVRSKKPHKCPVCCGHGKLGYPQVLQDKCHACEGKGIVWSS